MKKYFKDVSYALKLGFLSYLIFATILVLANVINSSSGNVGALFSPLAWVLIFLGLGPFFHILASLLILVFTLYKEKKLKLGEKLKTVVMNLLSLFILDILLIFVLIIYIVLNQSVCSAFHSSADICALMLAI